MTMLITYDLNKETKRPPIVDKIKEFEAWAKLSESTYAVNTSLSVNEVYNRLKPMFDDNDVLYIITLNKPWTGYGPKKVNEWLENNLS